MRLSVPNVSHQQSAASKCQQSQVKELNIVEHKTEVQESGVELSPRDQQGAIDLLNTKGLGVKAKRQAESSKKTAIEKLLCCAMLCMYKAYSMHV